MAKRMNRGFDLTSGHPVPLKESDCELWTASDSKKAQVLLSRNFPDKKAEDTLAMIAMLKKDIGQDYPEIEASIKQYLLEDG